MMNPLQRINRAATFAVLTGSVCMLLAMAQLIVWGLDRRPPFKLTGYSASTTSAGSTVVISASVERDLGRHCSVSYSRMFFDSAGTRYDITPGAQIMNAKALDDLNRRTPESLIVSVTVPEQATPGAGALVTVLDYVCNPAHQFYPVSVLLSMDITVL